MLGRTHVLTGFIIGLQGNLFFLCGCILGSVLPDIDKSNSLLGRKFKIVGWLSKHRGFFHSVFFGFIISAGLWFVRPELGYGLFGGFLSHLLLDGLTKEGILFFGIKTRGPIKVGGIVENLFFAFLLAILIIQIWN